MKIRPQLWKPLKVGTRVVSHAFGLVDFQAPAEARSWPLDKGNAKTSLTCRLPEVAL